MIVSFETWTASVLARQRPGGKRDGPGGGVNRLHHAANTVLLPLLAVMLLLFGDIRLLS